MDRRLRPSLGSRRSIVEDAPANANRPARLCWRAESVLNRCGDRRRTASRSGLRVTCSKTNHGDGLVLKGGPRAGTEIATRPSVEWRTTAAAGDCAIAGSAPAADDP